MTTQRERFDAVYAGDEATYGTIPSRELMRYVDQCLDGGRALDVAAGLGRDTLALARRGWQVTAVDVSDKAIARLMDRARREGLAERVNGLVADLCRLDYPPRGYDAIVATTAFDHVERDDLIRVLPAICAALTPRRGLYAEVHTIEDPGSPVPPGNRDPAPRSETADAIAHYFAPNELMRLVGAHLRIIHYEERREWDRTHGRPHAHGKAVALAVPRRAHPHYHGDRPTEHV